MSNCNTRTCDAYEEHPDFSWVLCQRKRGHVGRHRWKQWKWHDDASRACLRIRDMQRIARRTSGYGETMTMADGGGTTSNTRRDPPALEFSEEQRRIIRDSFANGASNEEFAVLMEVAKLRRLNPFTRQIWFIKRWDDQKKREVWAYQVSIDGLRAVAERTGLYDGQDEAECVYDAKGKLTCAKVRVYRKDWGRPSVGVAHFSEYAQTKRDGGLTKMWNEKPHVMLSKCAEALALRKAFPEDTSGLYVPEEMGHQEEAREEASQRAARQSPSKRTVDSTATPVVSSPTPAAAALPEKTATREAAEIAQAALAPKAEPVKVPLERPTLTPEQTAKVEQVATALGGTVNGVHGADVPSEEEMQAEAIIQECEHAQTEQDLRALSANGKKIEDPALRKSVANAIHGAMKRLNIPPPPKLAQSAPATRQPGED